MLKLKDEEAAQKFSQYFDWKKYFQNTFTQTSGNAACRAEGFIKFSIDADKDEALQIIEKAMIRGNNECADQIKLAAKDSYKRLLEPAISNEVLQEAKLKADTKAIEVFAENLRQLLLMLTFRRKRILAMIRGTERDVKLSLDEKGIYFIMKIYIRMHHKMKPELR